MIKKLSNSASPEIAELLNKLQADEENHASELRSRERDKLVVPAKLRFTDDDLEIEAFSRDVSDGGVGLIAPQPFSPGMVMELELNLHNRREVHLGECLWCCKFGDMHWNSGWMLQSAELDVESIEKSDAIVENDSRSNERMKFAIPVVVHPENELSRVHAFTRNMSEGGVNLVASQTVPEQTECVLEFIRINGERYKLAAKCVWSQKYGKSHWMSGWAFSQTDEDA